jgi:hypothetical protein
MTDRMEQFHQRRVVRPVLLRNDASGGRGDRARERCKKGRLPGAVPPGHHEGLPGSESEREILENEAPAATAGQILDEDPHPNPCFFDGTAALVPFEPMADPCSGRRRFDL